MKKARTGCLYCEKGVPHSRHLERSVAKDAEIIARKSRERSPSPAEPSSEAARTPEPSAEASTPKDLLRLLAAALVYLEPIQDRGPYGQGWKSDELQALVAEIIETVERPITGTAWEAQCQANRDALKRPNPCATEIPPTHQHQKPRSSR